MLLSNCSDYEQAVNENSSAGFSTLKEKVKRTGKFKVN